MKRPILHIDFETRSTINLPDTGMYVYAEHPTTDIWVACWSIGDGPVQVWYPGDACPYTIRKHVERGDPIYAHNAMFEYCIWVNILCKRYGWPAPSLEQLYCTASMAAAMALPRDLERACKAMGVAVQKDMAGRRLMLQMAKPRRIENGVPVWWNIPAKLERLTIYCANDVKAEHALTKVLRPLKDSERQVWLLDCKINMRGVKIDTQMVEHAAAISRRMSSRFNDELARLTRNQVCTLNKRDDLVAWLKQQGVDTDSIDKSSVLSMLRRDIPPAVRRVLEIRQLGGKSSTAKLTPMITRRCADGRVRENTMYHGASTGRFAGKGVQMQNMPDPNRVGVTQEMINTAFELMPQRDPDLIAMMCGDPLTIMSCCLRGMIIADPNKDLISADFANIEGRVLAWLAGEEKKLQAFRDYDAGTGPDLYKVAASGIFVKDIGLIDKRERNVGKVAELACGYQGGVNAFHSMAKGYNVNMAEAFPGLWKRQDQQQQDILEGRYKQYVKAGRKDDTDVNPKDPEDETIVLDREVWIASEITKQLWRENNPKIRTYWYDLEDAATQAVRTPGKIVPCREKIKFLVKNNVLWCQLPSKRCLAYIDPKEKEIETPWGAKKQSVTFMGIHTKIKQWMRLKSYGGLWAENVTQAVARDLLVDAMIRVEDAGYPVILSVHDELISEIPEEFGSIKEYEELMAALPDWAHGLPVVAEGWRAKRYQK